MDRMELASRHMSNARRHLITWHESHAVAEVRLALDALDANELSREAREWARQLRAAVVDDAPTIDSGRFMDLVDELASWLYWYDLASIS